MPPDLTERAELLSLSAHSKYFQASCHSDVPSVELLERALYVVEDAYGAARYSLPDDFLTYDHFMRAVRRLDMQSTPGYPYCLEATTIGAWLGFDGLSYGQYHLERLYHDVMAFLNEHEDFGDSFYRVFVKTEPHKLSKKIAGRWRLIICPPLYEQVAWSMLFGDANDIEIEQVAHIPSVQGMKLVNGDWKFWLSKMRNSGYDTAVDKTAWDWTVQKWLLDTELELRIRLCNYGPHRDQFAALAKRCYSWAFDSPRLLLTSGRVYRQITPGIMKSGCVNTISANSHMQIILHTVLCLRAGMDPYPLPIAVGDDTQSNSVNTPTVEEFVRFGAVVKYIDRSPEFVGHYLLQDGPLPIYVAKHLCRYLMVEDEHLVEFLESMVRLYAHSAAMQVFWRTVAAHHYADLPSEQFLLLWYDYDVPGLKSWWEVTRKYV